MPPLFGEWICVLSLKVTFHLYFCTHTHTLTHARTHTHIHTHARMHTHTHTQECTNIFSTGGGESFATKNQIPFLGWLCQQVIQVILTHVSLYSLHMSLLTSHCIHCTSLHVSLYSLHMSLLTSHCIHCTPQAMYHWTQS